jgi:hypothetical protein
MSEVKANVPACDFTVNDDQGGAPTRSFHFTTSRDGDVYKVQIANDGIDPYEVSLDRHIPTAQIPDQPARVKATGTLTLVTGSHEDRSVAIKYTGTLHTTHPTMVHNVVIATFAA